MFVHRFFATVSLCALVSLSAACSRSNLDRVDSSSVLQKDGRWRKVSTSDLIVTVPRVPEGGMTDQPFLKLTDVVDEENAQSIVRHLLLRTPQKPVEPDDEDLEHKLNARDFWGLDLNDPNIAISSRAAVALRLCNEDLANWHVGAIRFAPAEALLPGSPADWTKVAGGAPVSNGVQLRFSLRNACNTISDDAGIHVIYLLTSEGTKEMVHLPGDIKSAFLSGDGVKAREFAKRYFELAASNEYEAFRQETVREWLQAMDEFKSADANVSVTWDSLPERFVSAYRKEGFDAVLKEIMISLVEGDRRNQEQRATDLGAKELASRDTPSAKALRKRVGELLTTKGRLSHATVFFGSGMDKWNFGALSADSKGRLAPHDLTTANTFLSGTGSALSDIDVRLTSRTGLYETVGDFRFNHTIGKDPLFDKRIPNWDDFRKVNVAFPSGRTGVISDADPRASPRGSNDDVLVDRVMDVSQVNASNMACSVCHNSIVTQSKGVGPKRDGAFQMLNGSALSDQLNTRTAAELLHEVKALNAER